MDSDGTEVKGSAELDNEGPTVFAHDLADQNYFRESSENMSENKVR